MPAQLQWQDAPGRVRLHGNVYLHALLAQGARSPLQSALRADSAHVSRLGRSIRQGPRNLFGKREVEAAPHVNRR